MTTPNDNNEELTALITAVENHRKSREKKGKPSDAAAGLLVELYHRAYPRDKSAYEED